MEKPILDIIGFGIVYLGGWDRAAILRLSKDATDIMLLVYNIKCYHGIRSS